MADIETGIAPPPLEKKKPRARRAKQAVINPASSLLSALKFISPTQKKTGDVQQQHCIIGNKWVAASNGILTMAARIDEDLSANPHTLQFIDALSKVGEDLAITALEGSLSVVSGAFRAQIPTADGLFVPAPDAECGAVGERLIEALRIVAPLATDGAGKAIYGGVLIQAGSVVATNGACIVESWHGINLPKMLVPKASIGALLKCGKIPVSFGFSESSLTFYFEDGSLLKTQLFAEQFPHYQPLFDCEGLNPWDLPEEFFKAVKSVESFSRDGIVFFKNNSVSSSYRSEDASVYKIEGLPENMGFNSKYLLSVQDVFKRVHFANDRAYFFGGNTRGIIMGVETSQETAQNAVSDENDEIPF